MDCNELVIRYWQANLQQPFSAHEGSLFVYLMGLAASLGGQPEFTHADGRTCQNTGMSEFSLRKARIRLQEAGLLDFTVHAGRGKPTSYRLGGGEKGQPHEPFSIKGARKGQPHEPFISQNGDIGAAPGAENQQVNGFEGLKTDSVPALTHVHEHADADALNGVNTPEVSNSIIFNNLNNNITTPPPCDAPACVHVSEGEGCALDADALPGYLNLRGVDPAAVSPFVDAHAGLTYPNRQTLTLAARTWIRQQKPKAPTLTLEERKQAFREELAEYRRKNPGKYEDGMYKNFFDHWTETSPGSQTMRLDLERRRFGASSSGPIRGKERRSAHNNGTRSGTHNGTHNGTQRRSK